MVLRLLTWQRRFDRAATFLADLPFPTAVKVWRDGILVAAAHFGSWECMPLVLGQKFKKPWVVSRVIDNPYMDGDDFDLVNATARIRIDYYVDPVTEVTILATGE